MDEQKKAWTAKDGFEDEDVEKVNGGWGWQGVVCPNCSGTAFSPKQRS